MRQAWKLIFSIFLFLLSTVSKAEYQEAEPARWEEEKIEHYPAPPQPENLLPFIADSATDNRFFVDSASIQIGGDGVVRYTLVVKTTQGAENVSYEGIRCQTREVTRYAFARSDGSWVAARQRSWERIEKPDRNRHHIVLYADFFCGELQATAATIITALKNARH